MKIWKQIESICLNLESSLAARLGSASAKLRIAGSIDLLIFLLVLGESSDYGKQLPNLISDLFLIRFDLEDLISSENLIGQRLTIKDPQRSCRMELTAELEEASGEVRRKLFSGAG